MTVSYFKNRVLNTITPNNRQNIIYNDDFLLVCTEQNENIPLYSAVNEQKLILISGTINIVSDLLLNGENPAKYFLDNYTDTLEEFLLQSSGNYLFLVYDRKTHKITATRDILGLKHIFYTKNAKGFCLSDKINNILVFNKNHNEISRYGLELYLTFQYLPQPFTIFEEIYQLPLNSSINYDKGIIYQTKFGKSYIEMITSHHGNTEDTLENILTKSFKRQLKKNNSNIGAFLSGGMDTSSNIAILASKLGIYPTAFTARFLEQEYDETYYADIMAKKYNLKHILLTIKPDFISGIASIAALFDNPIADRAIIPEFIICRQAAKHDIDYMVTGEGGDEVLGYPRNLSEDYQMQSFEETDNNKLAEYYYSISALTQKNLINKILNSDDFQKEDYLTNLYESFNSYSPFEKLYFGQWQTWMIDNVLIKDLQIFSHFGFSFVSPYMDIDLMNHFILLKPEVKINKLRHKNYLKEQLQNILPQEIIQRKKHKFNVPFTQWLRNELFIQTYDTLTSADSISAKYMNQKFIKEMLLSHKEVIKDYNRPLWALLFLENWFKSKNTYIYG